MRLRYKFSVDVFKTEYISGWCFPRFAKSSPADLEFYDGHVHLGGCSATNLRDDLVAQGVHPEGRVGFTFFFPEKVNWQNSDPIEIRIKDTATILCRLEKNLSGKAIPSAGITESLKTLFKKSKPGLIHPVFFMHIPKTAGTSFNSFVQKYFGAKAITHIEAFDKSAYSDIADQYQYVAGHLSVERFSPFFPTDKFCWMTILREPYGHLHSHINWLRGIGAQTGSDFYKSHHPAFKEIGDKLGCSDTLDHEGLQQLVDSLDGVLAHIFDNCQTRYFSAIDAARVVESDKEMALANLARFHCVGVTEKFAAFQEAFLSRNKASVKIERKKLNTAKFGSLYDYNDPVAQEIVKPLVVNDLVLYQAALKMVAG